GARILQAEEEKGFVLPDWPANRAAVLILVKNLLCCCEKVMSIQERITVELEAGTVKLVCSGLRYCVQNGAGVATIFWINRISHHLHFLDGVGVRRCQR